MNKSYILFFSILFITFLYIFNVEKIITNQFSALTNSISTTYLNLFIKFESALNKYFDQLNYIDQLTTQNEKNQYYKTMYMIKSNELNQTLKENNEINLPFDKTKVLYYNNFYDNSKVILDTELPPKDRIFALITQDGNSAGIVLNKEDKSVSLLNNNKKCNYTVFIGENNAPGITSGMTNEGLLIIKHIPIWKKINIKDKVITSGMDNIFPFGINVGTVVSIENMSDTKQVLIKPFADLYKNRIFYIYKDNQNKQ
ncbi:MAG: rod shape-determining protein MreC [Campylobacterota bacterium]|nr:rod shape-determining protein MreC [Campylobacterota bacterium]